MSRQIEARGRSLPVMSRRGCHPKFLGYGFEIG